MLGPHAGQASRADSGRRKLLSRLGREADDPITEFLELALAYERIHPPSLQGFLHWLERSDVEIKRDPEQGQHNAVRVMTVHGAKGLQAPIVFLPDTCQTPDTKENLLWPAGRRRPARCCCGRRAAPFAKQVAEAERRRAAAQQMQEYRRLLYVAMTRASDRLIVCGWLTRKQKNGPPGSLLVPRDRDRPRGRGATEIEDAVPCPACRTAGLIDCPRVLRLTCPQETQRRSRQPASDDETVERRCPPGRRAPAPDEPPPPRPLRPSHAEDEQPPVLAPLADPSALPARPAHPPAAAGAARARRLPPAPRRRAAGSPDRRMASAPKRRRPSRRRCWR